MVAPGKSYTQDEVNEILKRALSQQALAEQTLSHEELLQVAAEVGIDPSALEAASTEIAKTREAEVQKRAESAEVAAERKIQLRRLLTSGLRLGVLNAVLYVIAMNTGGGTWFEWPLIGSGVLLALQLRHVIAPGKRLQRRLRREERQRRREQRRAELAALKQKLLSLPDSPSAAAREFESAVQAGVTALVKVATRKLEEHVDRHNRRR